MKKFTLITLVIATMMTFTRQSHAQGTFASLFLLIDGSGSISPLQNGEMLEVDTNYTMTAIPDSGFAFGSWQPVNVFISTSLVTNEGTVYGTTNTVMASIPDYIETNPLTFTMQPQEEIANNVYESSGWQANFVPVPEPSEPTVFVCGFAAVTLIRHKRIAKSTGVTFHSKTRQHFGRVWGNIFPHWFCQFVAMSFLLLLGENVLRANPTGGTVTQGSATFSSSGSQFNIDQTSANALVNWQTFNIGVGETVNFNQPSASSVTWNQISDPNPSQILGSLNANGYIVLQNSSGFVVGGQAAITAHGLIMTTASTPALNLSSGGPWSFNTPPPAAKIVNYGQINIAGGGPAFLIANDIENNGTISAPNGKIGLYAGETVLVSTSPNGLGLSAQVTLPEGSVDNEGHLIADGGSIIAQAQTVNQNGVVQANSVQDINGTIELVASDSVNLGANSAISAQGDSTGTSTGGTVTIKSDNAFSDQAGSAINISGGAQGGNGGQVEISAPQMSAINSTINGQAVDGSTSGALTIDPYNILLSSSGSSAPGSGTVNAGDPPTTTGSTLMLNVSSFASTLSQINLQAQNNIELNTIWTLSSQTTPATLSLTAGNDITLDNGSSIQAGNNWSVNLMAGTTFVPTVGQPTPASGNDGIYLDGSAYIQAVNGNVTDPSLNTINLWAANEVQVGWSGQSAGTGNANSGSGAIRTTGGGNIDVTTKYGDVNSGSSLYGFNNYSASAPYYTPSSSLGGIGTTDGGNVIINAGGDVISYPTFPTTTAPVSANDPGTGAFDPTAPGNVTINAGGSVYGNFVEADGTGTINAGQNIGTSAKNVALSLINGGWNLNAQGNIYLQEVRNPNGVFNNSTVRRGTAAGNHLFDYNPEAWVSLTAGNGVYLTGNDLPRPNGPVPLILPPIVTINAGPGGVVLDTPTATDGNGVNDVTLSDDDITLFPSPYQSLQITTTGGGWLSGGNANGTSAYLLMSDSGLTQWYNPATVGSSILPFGPNDHASVPALLNNNEPVSIDLDGSQLVNGVPTLAGMENIILQTDKATQINVAGDMIGCSFFGENLHPSDVTSITVGGQIYNAGSFTSVALNNGLPTLPLADTPLASEIPPGVSLSSWYLALVLAVNPAKLPTQAPTQSQLANLFTSGYLNGALEFQSLDLNSLVYNPNTKTLTVIGPLSSALLNDLESPTLTVVRFGSDGLPMTDASGHLELDTINWVPNGSANAALISSLYTDSQATVPLGSGSGAYVVGGTGQFNITAGSISLGNSDGILSVGNGQAAGANYSYLTPYITSGANINVTVLGQEQTVNGQTEPSLFMPASTIAALGGGDVNVTCEGEMPNSDGVGGVSMDLGSQDLLSFESQIMDANSLGLGIYTTAGGDVNVTALGTINVDSSRIATFDGGSITVVSETGDVNAGTGGTSVVPVEYYAPGYSGSSVVEYVPANGIVAGTLTAGNPRPPGAALIPGNITVITPQGSIYASAGGISQIAYDEILTASSGATTIGLFAGTPVNFNGDWFSEDNDWLAKPPLYVGNIVLGNSGVIGVNVVAKATGSINGLIISQQNADITTAQNADVTVLAGGKANVSSSGTFSGLVIAAGGVNISGGGNLSATILTTSVNGGAGTLATSSSVSSTGSSAAGQTSAENQQQVASDSTGSGDKKKKKKEELARVGRVTVILPKSS